MTDHLLPSKNETLLAELKAWMASDAGRKFACVRNYPFLDKNHDPNCEGCLIVACVKALSADEPVHETSDDGWRPIETAPRVYRPPLSHYNHHAPEILGLFGQAWYCVCSWGGPSQPFWIDGNNNKIAFQPTHWMPLPAAPGSVEETGTGYACMNCAGAGCTDCQSETRNHGPPVAPGGVGVTDLAARSSDNAIKALRQLLTAKHIHLGDLIYQVREREGEGWDGPAVTAWAQAVSFAEEVLKRAENGKGDGA